MLRGKKKDAGQGGNLAAVVLSRSDHPRPTSTPFHHRSRWAKVLPSMSVIDLANHCPRMRKSGSLACRADAAKQGVQMFVWLCTEVFGVAGKRKRSRQLRSSISQPRDGA